MSGSRHVVSVREMQPRLQLAGGVGGLNLATERVLFARWRDHHDGWAAHMLVSRYRPIVSEIAAVYASRYEIPFDEMIGDCSIGLMLAICRFDPDCGERFAPYGVCHVLAAAQEAILNNWLRLELGTEAARRSLLGTLRHTVADLREFEHRMPNAVATARTDSVQVGPSHETVRPPRHVHMAARAPEIGELHQISDLDSFPRRFFPAGFKINGHAYLGGAGRPG